MRLVCPNCGAQYEVDDRVVPEGGRDVQCSNCGHAWFQRSANWQERAPEHDPDAALAAPESAHETPLTSDDDWDDDETSQPMPERPRRELDEGVRDILAEEAQRELAARAQDGGTVETQGELGIEEYGDPEEERRRIARERMARMRGIEEGETLEPEVAPVPPPGPQARRDMFPDIDEINSTLDTPDSAKPKPKRAARPKVEDGGERARGGFSRGFSIIILLVAIAFGVYVFSPRIIDLFPGLTDAMVSYVGLVNQLFAWIEGLMQTVIDKLETAAGEG
ncbi:MAG: zinc-ribbon domain-containing protein [Pseudomonadota bacterium]|nr:zinc-ribbon domain-containing protein [Pseudomonadota bacterium]